MPALRLLLTPVLAACVLTTAAPAAELGQKIDDFALKSHYGKEYRLADLADKQVVIVAFVGAECPLAKLYAPRLAEISDKLNDRGVALIGINSNQQDSIQKIAAYATRHKIEFPILKDTGNAVADRFGAQRTPEVFVLDRDRVVRYRGRIDDQYGFDKGVGYQRPKATRDDLLEAVNELLDGKPVTVASTDAVGCVIGRVREPKHDSEVTYSNQIARIFQNHCVECHRPGRIGPFHMTSYDEVAGWGEMIGEVVEQERMPPWHAHPAYGHFANDLSLSDEDKQAIATWVKNGCPEGDPSQLPEPKQFAEGWAIGEPDQIVYMSDEPVDVPAEGVIDYYHFVVDPGWTEDKWIMAAEALPESFETVHHILVFVQPPSAARGFGFGGAGGNRGPRGGGADAGNAEENRAEAAGDQAGRRRGGFAGRGRAGAGAARGGGPARGAGGGAPGGGGGIGNGNLIAGYAPGMNPMLATDGKTAMHVKAGSRLVFQLHYTPNGSPARDRSYVGFKFADPENVEYVARSTAVANPLFVIPPGESDYSVKASGTFEHDTLLANFTPHMHMRGKAFRYEAEYPDGTKEILLDVPGYDFNWQTTYHLQEPKLMPKGTKLLATAVWDNSEENLSNPDPSETVTWGDQSWEEMMIGFYVEVFPKGEVPEAASGARAFGRLDPEEIFQALDRNRDGKLTKDELPGRLAERIGMADTDGDGVISLEELKNMMRLISAFSGQRD